MRLWLNYLRKPLQKSHNRHLSQSDVYFDVPLGEIRLNPSRAIAS